MVLYTNLTIRALCQYNEHLDATNQVDKLNTYLGGGLIPLCTLNDKPVQKLPTSHAKT